MDATLDRMQVDTERIVILSHLVNTDFDPTIANQQFENSLTFIQDRIHTIRTNLSQLEMPPDMKAAFLSINPQLATVERAVQSSRNDLKLHPINQPKEYIARAYELREHFYAYRECAIGLMRNLRRYAVAQQRDSVASRWNFGEFMLPEPIEVQDDNFVVDDPKQ